MEGANVEKVIIEQKGKKEKPQAKEGGGREKKEKKKRYRTEIKTRNVRFPELKITRDTQPRERLWGGKEDKRGEGRERGGGVKVQKERAPKPRSSSLLDPKKQ